MPTAPAPHCRNPDRQADDSTVGTPPSPNSRRSIPWAENYNVRPPATPSDTPLRFPALGRALDGVTDGLAFYDLTGALIWANQVLIRLLGERRSSCSLQCELDVFVTELAECFSVGGLGVSEEEACRVVSTGSGRYRLRASHVEAGTVSDGGAWVVIVSCAAAEAQGDDLLRERYGLSKQELKVTRLLAEGRSNEGLARILCISPHTARHHTERVLSKLQVHSRAAIAAKLLSG